MPKVPKENTRSRTALKKKNDSAVDELQQQVAMEKKKQEDKKKERAEEKKAEDERWRKSDEEKAKANAVTISPPNVDDATTGLDTMVLNADDEYIAQAHNWTEAEDTEALASSALAPTTFSESKQKRHLRRRRRNLLRRRPERRHRTMQRQSTSLPLRTPPRERELRTPTYRAQLRRATVTPQSSFSIATTAHSYNHPHTFVEAAIALTKEDKPREFIAAIKLLLSNGKILDPNFALAPLKRDTAMK
jgi:hypothetical protein